jgi:GNAT superfamily N-acetyltransferase
MSSLSGSEIANIPTMLCIRDTVLDTDTVAVREIVASSGFFHDHEIEVAAELVTDRLRRRAASDYLFLFGERDGRVVGYTCYGPIACTTGSFDLYWIAVHDRERGGGIGRELLRHTEHRIAAMQGRRIYIETSSREQYAPTRRFYERCGYSAEAQLRDFYAPGDDKVIYVRSVDRT